jgi:hypothetical protein
MDGSSAYNNRGDRIRSAVSGMEHGTARVSR